MKKILIINGHPNPDSFSAGLSEAYKKGAEKSRNEIKEIDLGKLRFNLNLSFGYQKRTDLEPDLLEAWEKITWAEHMVWIYPQWWGFMPALLKGFIDRLFLPGIAFKYRENSVQWDKFLTGKTAHLIHTMDYPVWYYKWFLRERGIKIMKKQILDFVGIKTVKTTLIAPIKNNTEAFRQKWLERVERLGQQSS